MAPSGLIWLAPLLGLIVGSFLGALTYRLPRGKSVAEGRSQCPVCLTPLQAIDLVPVLSWLAMGGKCRHCRTPISPRYPLIEASTALVFLAAALIVDAPLLVGTFGMAGAFVVAGAVLWLEHRMVSWVVWLPAFALGSGAILGSVVT